MRVVVADDEKLFRHMLVSLLQAQGIDVVGQAASEPELLTVVHSTTPDLVLADLRMPPEDRDAGLRAAMRIRHDHPAIGVVLLSKYGEAEYASELLRALHDRVGYILKDRINTISELVTMLERVSDGDIVLDPQFISPLVQRTLLVERLHVHNPLDQLAPYESRVLTLMAEGFSNAAIARQLKTTDGSVEKAMTAIRRKLELAAIDDTNARVQTVLTYLRHTGQLRGGSVTGAADGDPADA